MSRWFEAKKTATYRDLSASASPATLLRLVLFNTGCPFHLFQWYTSFDENITVLTLLGHIIVIYAVKYVENGYNIRAKFHKASHICPVAGTQPGKSDAKYSLPLLDITYPGGTLPAKNIS